MKTDLQVKIVSILLWIVVLGFAFWAGLNQEWVLFSIVAVGIVVGVSTLLYFEVKIHQNAMAPAISPMEQAKKLLTVRGYYPCPAMTASRFSVERNLQLEYKIMVSNAKTKDVIFSCYSSETRVEKFEDEVVIYFSNELAFLVTDHRHCEVWNNC